MNSPVPVQQHSAWNTNKNQEKGERSGPALEQNCSPRALLHHGWHDCPCHRAGSVSLVSRTSVGGGCAVGACEEAALFTVSHIQHPSGGCSLGNGSFGALWA